MCKINYIIALSWKRWVWKYQLKDIKKHTGLLQNIITSIFKYFIIRGSEIMSLYNIHAIPVFVLISLEYFSLSWFRMRNGELESTEKKPIYLLSVIKQPVSSVLPVGC